MKPWHRRTVCVAACIAATYGMIYADVVLRARSAYLQGEQYTFWADHPDERAKVLDQKFVDEKAQLDAKKANGRLTSDDYDREIELMQFDHREALKESSIKYAYVWYQTAVDLFSPPNSKWVQWSRQKMPIAKERWKAELRAQKIPFEDYMID